MKEIQAIQEIQQEALFAIIRKAGLVILEASSRLTEQEINSKAGSANYVTTYDIQVQQILEESIHQLMPSASFLAEEDGEDQNSIGPGWTFVIDPIDGTSNFIHDYRWSAISVGLLLDGVPVWGAVYQPYTDEMFSATKGQGAFLNGRQIYTSNRALGEAIVAIGTAPYERERLGRQTMELATQVLMKSGDIRRGGSAALDLCYVACGRADAFYELVLSPWDFMAGSLIVQEAGGWISTVSGEALPVSGVKSSVAAGGNALRKEFMEILVKCGGLHAV